MDEGYSDAHRLCIIIPAYKARYLKDSLASIANQTVKDFKVYIGDDHSPENLKDICLSFAGEIDLEYHRFPENLGGISLVQQWQRCIALSKEEPWIWLFSDDDVMEPQCVEWFYRSLSDTKEAFDVYRFNNYMTDADGAVTLVSPQHPATESGFDFARARLRAERISSACEYIFSRRAYSEKAGIVEFPLAWCSDDATWIKFSGNRGIYTIAGPRVHWRTSGLNISTNDSRHKGPKMIALVQYLYWLNDWIRSTSKGSLDAKLKFEERKWLYMHLDLLDSYLTPQDCLYLARHFGKLWNINPFRSLLKLANYNYKRYKKRHRRKS